MENSKGNIHISDSEWKVMKVLWEKPDLTLKEISAKLEDTKWSYTTIRTLVTRLMDKGAIKADKTSSNFLYSPAIAEKECKTKEINSFLSKVFDGSVSMMVSALTKDSKLTEEEQKKLMSIIEKIES
ncbi:BlaI/MecI/CopY family transcriptional regulator [Sinanaerobacter chloroacetimidivorans]|uniref:BlaI/MecI/CopY family transcriptional regulator n=1 Tax=Sinanaerobacter chloroacetimidivorans TaxID=2818044 RepID=A0A8J8B1J5_9FIRM|nr:BlaI/MecI/CopY family transcriptional regulator [Sinanaerobacter chloroacetimidivorans]MBR0598778.1 BlaI/MecI/CopY family transcriptional regulator [Sinanaerobacter chloroacetimidivorans]